MKTPKTKKKNKAASDAAKPAKPPRILLIEDDEFMVRILSREFSRAGLTDITIVSDGTKAKEQFEAIKPDVIVLDILLPGKSGLEALKDIRRLKEGKQTPVLVLSNYGNVAYRAEAEKLGVREYLIKSSTLVSDLIDKIKKLGKK